MVGIARQATSPARPVDRPVEGTPEPAEQAIHAAIARQVRTQRRQLGLTVAQLSERSGISKGMLSKIENAQASPSLATLARLASAVGVPVTSFFRGLETVVNPGGAVPRPGAPGSSTDWLLRLVMTIAVWAGIPGVIGFVFGMAGGSKSRPRRD